MALQVWLPLNGDLRNLGAANIIFNSGRPSFSDDGKIGKCMSTGDAIFNLPETLFDSISETNTFSFACWCKDKKGSGKNRAFWLGNGNKRIRGYYENRVATNLNWAYASTGQDVPINIDVLDGEWHHIVFASDGVTNKLTVYIDGIFQNEIIQNYTMSLGGTKTLSLRTTDKKLNDFRLYDHCLSALEIKEISQALVLHYKLNGLLGGIGENIILTNSNFSNGTVDWSNWATVQSREIITIEDKKWAHIVKTANKYGGYSREITIKPNTIYTVSATFYASDTTKGILWWHYRSSESGANLSQNMKSFNLTTIPQRYSAQIPIYTNGNYTVDRLNLMIGTPTEAFGNVDIYFTDVKIEEGSIATSYVQSNSELGIDTTKIYDSSGYGNDGVLTGILETSNDTSRYQLSSFFNGADTAIQIPYNATIWQDNFTINLWFKKDELGSKNYETLIGGPSGFEMDTRIGSATTLSFYMASVRGGNVYSPFNFGEWYMVTLVNNGTNELYYVNGNLIKTIEKKSMPTGNYFIGAWQTKTKQNYKGNISDFRIYATALDEKAIKKLYNTPTEIDKNYNYHTMELDEIANNISVKKTGKTKAKVFTETTNNNTFFKNGTVNGHFIIEK